ncbi:cation:proton antiporter [Gordonia insulae]|uniref:Na(+)/H(+)-K(+) antiporter GerN n=1 Tax=Gordonia insulae TaxID=2420509 RepID=A0A3G8JV93_9ACTN|nr:cation:proton antiporter [Gordonia insulae]AZG48695.1 Na(+)/H(+)-K(+) antiporter GerN [Gordonia insulae]
MFLLAEASSEVDASATISLFWIAVVAVISPLISRLSRGYIPDAVVLLVLGMVVGPNMLGWADSGDVAIISQMGLGLLFLLAGYELDPKLLGGKPGRVARLTWLVGLVFAWGAVTLAVSSQSFSTHVAVAIALTSTALGTLLPILREAGLLDTPLGRSVMAHGAVGELGPILAMSLLLTSRNLPGALLVLVLFGIAAVIIGVVPQRIVARLPGVRRAVTVMRGGTIQLPVRIVILLLVSLMTVAAVFDLDVVLGAFAAGLILRRLIGPEQKAVGSSLEVIGFGVFIPVFFVTSGMGIDIAAVLGEPGFWAVLVVAIGVARGLPVWFSERYVEHGANLEFGHERAQLALYAATGLPIIVAVTQVAMASDLMSVEVASTLVAAGATTVLLFPMIARLIGARHPGASDDVSRTEASM